MFWKIIKRTLLIIILLFLTLFLLFVGLIVYSALFGLKTIDTDITRYDEYRSEMLYASEFMPSLDELGPYQDIAFGQAEVYYMPFFISESMNLFVKYSDADYQRVKSQALASHQLITEDVYDYSGYLIMMAKVDYYGYSLQAFQCYKHLDMACKHIGFIGFDDDQHSVCYLIYNDDDRDFIADQDEDPLKAMYRWLKKEFWWHTFDK